MYDDFEKFLINRRFLFDLCGIHEFCARVECVIPTILCQNYVAFVAGILLLKNNKRKE